MKQDKPLKAEEMDSRVFENSEVPYHNEPEQNAWEKARWNSNGYDQSGMK